MSRRDVTALTAKLRALFLWTKTHKNNVRFKDSQSKRTQPLPKLPDGPHARLSANYYCTRDARREVEPPTITYLGGQKALPSGEASGDTSVQKPKFAPVTPGFTYEWNEGVKEYKDRI